MSRVVLSIGSNLGDRLAWLQSVVDGLDGAVRVVSPVYETDAWGGVEQGPFLNAVLVAEDPALDCHGWLRRGTTVVVHKYSEKAPEGTQALLARLDTDDDESDASCGCDAKRDVCEPAIASTAISCTCDADCP